MTDNRYTGSWVPRSWVLYLVQQGRYTIHPMRHFPVTATIHPHPTASRIVASPWWQFVFNFNHSEVHEVCIKPRPTLMLHQQASCTANGKLQKSLIRGPLYPGGLCTQWAYALSTYGTSYMLLLAAAPDLRSVSYFPSSFCSSLVSYTHHPSSWFRSPIYAFCATQMPICRCLSKGRGS